MGDVVWLFVPVILPTAFYYADFGTDLGALQVFLESGQLQYFGLNLFFIAASSLWGGGWPPTC